MSDHKQIFIIYPSDDEINSDKSWQLADRLINGFEMCCDLNESLSKALIYAKNSRCEFIVQYRNKSKAECKDNVECFLVKPTDTNIHIFFK